VPSCRNLEGSVVDDLARFLSNQAAEGANVELGGRNRSAGVAQRLHFGHPAHQPAAGLKAAPKDIRQHNEGDQQDGKCD
jgi:hypothetical protein